MAYSAYSAYSSKDGGLTWNEGGFSVQPCGLAEPSMTELTLEPAGLHFRYQPGQNIESSSDGSHWELAYPLAPLTEADEAYYQKIHSGNPAMRATPLAGIADPQHGSVIFAMGHEGVLVRQSSGEWTWAALGSYRKIDAVSAWSFMTTVLSGEIVLAVALILLILSFGAFIRRRHWIWSGSDLGRLDRVGPLADVIFAGAFHPIYGQRLYYGRLWDCRSGAIDERARRREVGACFNVLLSGSCALWPLPEVCSISCRMVCGPLTC